MIIMVVELILLPYNLLWFQISERGKEKRKVIALRIFDNLFYSVITYNKIKRRFYLSIPNTFIFQMSLTYYLSSTQRYL